MSKVTEWYPAEIKPVRPGVYQTDDSTFEGRYYNRFDGRRWHWGDSRLSKAARYDPMPRTQVKRWRGLAKGG